jgi:rhomboid protease GluP
LSGSLASVLLDPPNIVSVGASGGIVGLLVALFVASFRLPFGEIRTRLQWRASQAVIPALLPIMSQPTGVTIDYAAHFGGALAGGSFALVMLQIWPHERPEPRFGRIAAGFILLFVAVSIGSIVPIMHFYQHAK